MDELIDVAVVGQPVVYGAGFIALLIVVLAFSWVDPLLSVAHEGGHMIMAVVTFRGFSSWKFNEAGAVTQGIKSGWGPGWLITLLAGYLAPSVLGLAGAAVLADGNAWGVLVIAAVLLVGALLYAEGAAANIFTAILLGVVVLLLWRGSQFQQMIVAAGLVWLMLIGGFADAVKLPRRKGDAAAMAKSFLLPGIVWQAFWVTASLVSLYAGARLLFVGDAWPDGVWPFDERA